MRQQRQPDAHVTQSTHWWALRTAALAVLVGATGIAAQELAPQPNQRQAIRPFREPPRLLSEAEVEQGLAARHRALRERFLAHEQGRHRQPMDDYAVPAPPPNVHVPPRPDAPGGEFDTGGVQ